MKDKQDIISFTNGIGFSRDIIINLLAELEGNEPLLNMILHGLMDKIRQELTDCFQAAYNDSLTWRGEVIKFKFDEN